MTGELQVCAECGCTDDWACPGGCSWFAVDLCSRCASSGRPEPVVCQDGGSSGCCCWPGPCAGHVREPIGPRHPVTGRSSHLPGVPCNEPSFHGNGV